MLRVGLTGGLGSGKSTVGAMLAEMGAVVVSADEIGRELMRPGQAVFAAIVGHFGEGVLADSGELDRGALSRLAFDGGRLEELNALVHPAVIARQAAIAAEVAVRQPGGVFVVESALLFETVHGGAGGWRERFDRVVLVVAPAAMRAERFVARTLGSGVWDERAVEAARAEAGRRMRRQMPEEQARGMADFVIENAGTTVELRARVEVVWARLEVAAR